MNILKYVGVYLLGGFILHFGWTIIFEAWIWKKVGAENFGDSMGHYILLKMQLYDKHTALGELRAYLEALANGGAANILALIALTLVTWPVALFEDFAVYTDMVDYVYDVARSKESSES